MTDKMDPIWKEKWLTALRGGTYQQGKCYLKKKNKFCCLGVLCDIVDSTQWENMMVCWASIIKGR